MVVFPLVLIWGKCQADRVPLSRGGQAAPQKKSNGADGFAGGQVA
jgi:hypothetical protein